MSLLVTPLHSDLGAAHMAKDLEAFLAMETAGREGVAPDPPTPILRLYQWSEPTVSLGRGQTAPVALAPKWETWSGDPASDPDGPAAVVQRPTGGRGVWHEDELTYSVIFPLEHPIFEGGRRGPDEVFGNWLWEAGRRAGIDGLSLERGGSSRDPLGLGPAPCFASTSRHELKWLGVKWVGSARRLGKHALLQHGAIRLGPAGDKLERWLTGTAPEDLRPWSTLPSADLLAQSLIEMLQEKLRERK